MASKWQMMQPPRRVGGGQRLRASTQYAPDCTKFDGHCPRLGTAAGAGSLVGRSSRRSPGHDETLQGPCRRPRAARQRQVFDFGNSLLRLRQWHRRAGRGRAPAASRPAALRDPARLTARGRVTPPAGGGRFAALRRRCGAGFCQARFPRSRTPRGSSSRHVYCSRSPASRGRSRELPSSTRMQTQCLREVFSGAEAHLHAVTLSSWIIAAREQPAAVSLRRRHVQAVDSRAGV
jgi:hypothetical protein